MVYKIPSWVKVVMSQNNDMVCLLSLMRKNIRENIMYLLMPE